MRDMDITYATPKVLVQIKPLHVHHFIPQLSFKGELIGVCNDPDCTVTLSAAEIVRRINER